MQLANTGYVIHKLIEHKKKWFRHAKSEWVVVDTRGIRWRADCQFSNPGIYETLDEAKKALEDFKNDGKIVYKE